MQSLKHTIVPSKRDFARENALTLSQAFRTSFMYLLFRVGYLMPLIENF